MKKTKHREAHSANAKFGMGDYYGQAVRQKVGKIRSVYPIDSNPPQPKSLKKPPKSLA
jgi:hypothetical protein